MTVGQRATLVVATASANSAFAGVFGLVTHLKVVWVGMAVVFVLSLITASLCTSDRRQP